MRTVLCRTALVAIALLTFAGCRNYGPSRGEKMRQLFVGFVPGHETRLDRTRLLSTVAAVRRESLLRIARRSDLRAESSVRLMVRQNIEPSPLVRATAAAVVRRLGMPTAIPELLASLREPNPLVRREIVTALGCLGREPHLTALQDVLRRDADQEVREAAVRAMGRIGGKQAVTVLIPLVEDRDDLLAYAANQALYELTGQNFGPSRRLWQKWWREHMDRPLKRPALRQGSAAASPPRPS